jgi:hypothetical protein
MGLHGLRNGTEIEGLICSRAATGDRSESNQTRTDIISIPRGVSTPDPIGSRSPKA